MGWYTKGFTKNPARELMPAKTRTGSGWQVWIEDDQGRRRLAYCSDREVGLQFACRVWLGRTAPACVVFERHWRGAVTERLIVGRDVPDRPPVAAKRWGDARDTWHDRNELPLPPDDTVLASAKMQSFEDVSAAVVEQARAIKDDPKRYLNVRVSPATRERLVGMAQRLGVSSADIVCAIVSRIKD